MPGGAECLLYDLPQEQLPGPLTAGLGPSEAKGLCTGSSRGPNLCRHRLRWDAAGDGHQRSRPARRAATLELLDSPCFHFHWEVLGSNVHSFASERLGRGRGRAVSSIPPPLYGQQPGWEKVFRRQDFFGLSQWSSMRVMLVYVCCTEPAQARQQEQRKCLRFTEEDPACGSLRNTAP